MMGVIILPKTFEIADTSADPVQVSRLVSAIASAMEAVSIADTTTADILSAIFTVLDRTLASILAEGSPEEKTYNSHEAGRVLMALLLKFGSSNETKH